MGVLTQMRQAGGNTFTAQIAESFYREAKGVGRSAAENPSFFAKVESFFTGTWRSIKFKFAGSSIGSVQYAQVGINAAGMLLKQIPIPPGAKDVWSFVADQGTEFALKKYSDYRVKTIDKESQGAITFKNYESLVSQRNEALWRKSDMKGTLDDVLKLCDDVAVLNREIIKEITAFNTDAKKQSCDQLGKIITRDQLFRQRMIQLRQAVLPLQAYANGVAEFLDSYAAERVANKYDLADSLTNYFQVTTPAHHWKVCTNNYCYHRQHGIK